MYYDISSQDSRSGGPDSTWKIVAKGEGKKINGTVIYFDSEKRFWLVMKLHSTVAVVIDSATKTLSTIRALENYMSSHSLIALVAQNVSCNIATNSFIWIFTSSNLNLFMFSGIRHWIPVNFVLYDKRFSVTEDPSSSNTKSIHLKYSSSVFAAWLLWYFEVKLRHGRYEVIQKASQIFKDFLKMKKEFFIRIGSSPLLHPRVRFD